MVFSRTNERQFNRAVVVMAPQASKGTPILDFTNNGGKVVWTRRVTVNENQEMDNFQGSSGSIMESREGLINTFQRPEMTIEFYPTPEIASLMLDSFAGPKSGSAWTWPSTISTWFTIMLAEVEQGGGASFNIFRLEDAWVRELEFNVGGFGVAVCRAQIIAEQLSVLPVSTGGLAYPAAISDTVQFAHRSAEIIRKPATSNINLPMKNVMLNLRHGFSHEPYNSDRGRIVKQGLLEVTGQLTTRMMDETAAFRDEALLGVPEDFRLRLIAIGDELRFDIHNVRWSPITDAGFENRDMVDYVQGFRAGVTDISADNTVDINLL